MISSSAAFAGRVRRRRGRQRLVHEAEQVDEVLLVWLDVEDASGELTAPCRLAQQRSARACPSGCSPPPACQQIFDPLCSVTAVVVPGS